VHRAALTIGLHRRSLEFPPSLIQLVWRASLRAVKRAAWPGRPMRVGAAKIGVAHQSTGLSGASLVNRDRRVRLPERIAGR
jgi:hypothetical protein